MKVKTAEENLLSLISIAENNKKVVNSSKQQIGYVMKQLPIYSGYYIMELSRKEGGTDWIGYSDEHGKTISSCRIAKDIENGTLYLMNDNYIPIDRLRDVDCVRVASCLHYYDYGKPIKFKKVGKMSFAQYKKNFVVDYLYGFYDSIYNYMKFYLSQEKTKSIEDKKMGELSLVDETIKWNDKLVPSIPILMEINPFLYTTGYFLEQNCFVLLKFFDKIK